MRTKPSLCAASAIAFLLLSSRVDAQPAPKKPAPVKPVPAPAAGVVPLAESLAGEAKADYDAARLLYGNADYAGAFVKFTAAHAKSKDPRLLWNIAACEKNLRHYSSLRGYLRRYLAEGDAVLSEAEKLDAAALLKAIEPLIAELDLSVNEPGARVFVDDVPMGETPLPAPLVVDVGPHKLRIEKDGFDVYRDDLTIGDSPRIKIVAKLDKATTDASLVVYTARPKDEIIIDGTLRGLGTWRGNVPSGGHTLRVAAPEMRPYQTEIFLRERESRTVAVTLEREPQAAPTAIPRWAWIGGGALVVTGLVIAGIILFQPDDKQPALPVGTLDPGNVQASLPAF